VHARAAHVADGGDGAGDLPFEGAAIVDLLEELGLSERGPVEQLVADAARRRHAGAREVQPEPIDVLLRDLDVAAAVGQLVLDLLGLEAGLDAGGLLGLHVGEQDAEVGRVEVPRRTDDQHDRRNEGEAERGQLPRIERGGQFADAKDEILHGIGLGNRGTLSVSADEGRAAPRPASA
jgi:hypothetical protein